MADKPKKQSPMTQHVGSLTGDRTLSDLIDQYNLRDYVAPAAAALVGVPVVGKFAKPFAKTVGREAARRADKYMGDAGLRLNVVKPEGGQWESDAAAKLQRNLVDRSGNKDIDRWLQTTARKYIMNRSGTPSDEIRLLADEGITHLSPAELRAGFEQGDRDIMKDVIRERVKAGYPNLGVSNTDLGSRWELRADAMIQPFKAEDFLYSSGMRREMPWLEKIDPKTPVYGHTLGDTPEHLGMDKLSEALRTEINAGRLRPEQLNKVSIGDAVKLAHQQRLAREAAAQETLQALPRVRDYPEGFTWQELTHEDPATLDMILKREGDIMQNCIGGYCSDVLEDGTRLFSLRDTANNPHVNIEMKRSPVTFKDIVNHIGEEKADELLTNYSPAQVVEMYPELRQYRINQVKGKQNAAPIEDYMPYVQDFVTNPVHGSPYSEVRDLQNTGLIDLNRLREHGLFDLSSTGARGREINAELNRIYPAEVDQFGGRTLSGPYGVRIPSYDMMRGVVQEMPGNYASPSSLIEYLRGVEPRPIEQGYSKYWEGVEKPEGFAKGGAVDFDHPDPDEAYEFRDFGLRQTGEPKEEGALGLIRMPDGMTDMTEYSINVDGKEMPSIIEGMHPADINYIRETGDVPEDAVRTAIHNARKREAQGKNAFYNRKEDKGYAVGGPVQAPRLSVQDQIARGRKIVEAYQQSQQPSGSTLVSAMRNPVAPVAPVAPARLSVPDQIARSKAIINAYQQAQKPSVNQRTAAAQVPVTPAPVTPAPVAPAPVAPAPVAQQPMYTKHEGMLFGDDFYDRYAQNVGGQFADPYQNFLMARARVTGPNADIANLYKQYQASGRTDTPDWAKLDTTGPMSMLPVLAHKWDASGANPVDQLSSAWNSTTPLVEGINVPEGYWDAVLAYNMNLSKWNPTSNTEKFDPEAYKEYNAAAYNAMNQGIYDTNNPVYYNYMSPKQQAQQAQSDANALASAKNYYDRMRENNNAHAAMYGYSAAGANSNLDARLAELEAEFAASRARREAEQAAALQAQMNSARYAKGGQVTARGYAEGGLVYNDYDEMFEFR